MNKIRNLAFLALFLGQVSSVYACRIHVAAKAGNLSEVKRLLDSKEASIEDRDTKLGPTALIVAAQNGHLEIVKELLNRGANIEAKENYGFTALLRAARGDYTEILIELLNRGANIEDKDKYGYTAINPRTVKAIREWSIENQVKDPNPQDLKLLDGSDPGSYDRDFAAYGSKEQRKAAIFEKTGIPQGPASIIH